MSQPSEEAARAQLERILASPTFARSGRLSRFLRFVVESALAGRTHELKEYTIGIEAFDKDPAYDPHRDASVRVEARRLRYKLRDYYEQEGRSDPVFIDLPKGGFVPQIQPRDTGLPARPLHPVRWLLAAGAMALVALLLIAWQRWPRPGSTLHVAPAALEVYQNGLRSRALRSAAGRAKAADFFREASRQAPGFAGAWADLSQVQITRAFHYETDRAQAVREAAAAAGRAVALDAKLPAPHRTLAWIHLYDRHDWTAAETEFRAALRLDPQSASTLNLFALGLASRGRFDESIDMARRAVSLDPRTHAASPDLGVIHYLARRPEESLKIARQVIDVGANPEAGRLLSSLAYWEMQQDRRALAEVEPLYRAGERMSWLMARMAVYAARHDAPLAARYLHEIDAKKVGHQEFHRAYALASLGRLDEAFSALDHALEQKDADLIFLRVEPMLDPLRADPRFDEFARRAGLQ